MHATAGPALLCYDGSDDARSAIRTAGALLEGRSAIVCYSWLGLSRLLLHGDGYAVGGILAEAAAEVDAADREQAERLAAEGAELAREAGFDAEPRVARERRKTWRTLCETAEECRASVIVAGAHGGSRLLSSVLGSVSNGLVQHATVPVLVVPRDVVSPEGPLLICFDGSAGARRAVEVAGDLLRERPVVVTNAWESPTSAPSSVAALAPSMAVMSSGLDEGAERHAGELSSEGVSLAHAVGLHEVRAETRKALRPVWHTIVEVADEEAASAIVIGRRGHTVMAAALGSVSGPVVHNSRRPVLVVPAEGEER